MWRRLDGSEVIVELRRDLAQDVMSGQFASGGVAAFMHINDGTGEGGSGLLFLASRHDAIGQKNEGQRLLAEVVPVLASGAVVVTDEVLADPEFRSDHPFDRCGKLWKPIGKVPNEKLPEGQLYVWRVVDHAGS